MQNALKFYLVLYIILYQEVVSKSLVSKGNSIERSVDSKAENDEMSIEDGIASEHDSMRSKHRHKSGARHREMSKRHLVGNAEDHEELRANCAVMYKNNEPVGILQPYEDSYKFLPICGDSTLVDISPVAMKKKSTVDVSDPSVGDKDYDDPAADNKEDSKEARKKREEVEENANEKSKYYDDKFPYLLAKFKIDSRLDNLRNPIKDLTPKKRDENSPVLDDRQVGSLKSTLSKMKADDNVAVEEELRDILDQMGLIDEEPGEETEVKREVEDENLEIGTNSIEMVKEEHTPTRSKREETNTQDTISPESEIVHSDNPGYKEETPIGIILKKRAYTTKATSTSCSKAEDKREIDLDGISSAGYDSTPNILDDQLLSYEKRVEREIRDKIQKLKEEVKKEIDALKSGNSKKSYADDTKRRKRQVVNTLIDEETRDIDPNLNDDESRTAHVRRKRSIDYSELSDSSYKSKIMQKQNATSIYRSRQLKAISEPQRKDTNTRFRRAVNEDSYAQDSENEEGEIREKREDSNNEEGSEYEYDDESGFADSEEESEDDKVSDDRGKEEVGSYENGKRCKCGKNGCKCGLEDVPQSNVIHDFSNVRNVPQSNIIFDYSNFMVDPEIVERDVAKGLSKHSDLSRIAEEDADNYEEDDGRTVDKRSAENENGEGDTIPSQSRLSDEKREIPSELNQHMTGSVNQYDDGDDYVNGDEADDRESKREVKPRQLKTFENGEYFVDLHPEMYRLSPIEESDADTTVAVHGAAQSHRSSLKRRRGIPQVRQKHHRIRRTIRSEDDSREPLQLTDMSEEDLFGALPQSYEGELVRYKRVKRDEDKKGHSLGFPTGQPNLR